MLDRHPVCHFFHQRRHCLADRHGPVWPVARWQERRTGVDPDQCAAGNPRVGVVVSDGFTPSAMLNARSQADVPGSDLPVNQVAIGTSPKDEVAMLHVRKMLRRFVRWLDWELGC
jgi:hypothetical protein